MLSTMRNLAFRLVPVARPGSSCVNGSSQILDRYIKRGEVPTIGSAHGEVPSMCDAVRAQLDVQRARDPLSISINKDKQTLSERTVTILSKNERGMWRDEQLEESVSWLERNNVFAACLQETWKLGDTIEEHRDYTIINHGPKVKLCNRGSLGVAIALNREATKAWETAGSNVYYFGLRIIAVRLETLDIHGRICTIFLASAYAPTGSAPAGEREKYFEDLQECTDACKAHEVLLICADTNASCGIRSKHDNPFEAGRDQVRGPFGAPYQNDAGRELVTHLATNQLCLPTTYFNSKTYFTWVNPGSNKGHQIDHFIMKQSDLKRVRKAGHYGLLGQLSDHAPVRLTLAIGRQLKKQLPDRPKSRVDRAKLKDEETCAAFIQATKVLYAADKSGDVSMRRLQAALFQAGEMTLTTTERRQAGWFEAAKKSLEPAVLARNEAQKLFNREPTQKHKRKLREKRRLCKAAVAAAEVKWYDRVMEICNFDTGFDEAGRPKSVGQAWAAIKLLRGGKSVTKKVTPMKLRKPDGGLCTSPQENADVMRANLQEIFSKPGTFDPAAIANVKQRDKRPWTWFDNSPDSKAIAKALHKLGNEKSGAEGKCPAEYFKALHTDVETCQFLKDVIKVYWESGSWPGNYVPPFEKPQPTLLPSDPLEAIKVLQADNWRISFAPNPHKAGTQVGAKYDAYASSSSVTEALSRGATLGLLAKKLKAKQLITHDPADEPDTSATGPLPDDAGCVAYPEWEVARLKLLPKKGDLSLCKNWRGICLLDIASKVVSSVIVDRMQLVQEAEGLEFQFGFRGGRGTVDGLFTTSLALQKRQEHNLDTWALFIDLVKAFDTVPREPLFAVLLKFGMPPHFVSIVKRLHTNAIMKFKVGNVDSDVASDIGVRQGSCEGPALFLFIVQAALETVDWPVAKPKFTTRAGPAGMVSGDSMRGAKKGTTTFELWASLFADDCALLFNTRADMIAGANCLFSHFRRFGLQMHIGRGQDASKTEAMYCPARGNSYDDADKSDFACDDGFISFTDSFKYLGAIIDHTLTSEHEITRRIAAANSAFGSLRPCIFAKKGVSRKVKGMIYTSLVLRSYCMGASAGASPRNFVNAFKPSTTDVRGP
jgi:exonuclease III